TTTTTSSPRPLEGACAPNISPPSRPLFPPVVFVPAAPVSCHEAANLSRSVLKFFRWTPRTVAEHTRTPGRHRSQWSAVTRRRSSASGRRKRKGKCLTCDFRVKKNDIALN
ncbi:hypothetical protein CEXT_710461, partial [Caerostris extrusa]